MDGLTPVHALLEHSADQHPDAVALEHGDVVLTYAEVEEGANRAATRLRELGVARGDRVGLLADNGRAYVEGFFGILKAGACCVALNGANKAHTSAALLADSGAVGLVTTAARVARDLPEIVHGAPDLRFVIIDRAESCLGIARGGESPDGPRTSRRPVRSACRATQGSTTSAPSSTPAAPPVCRGAPRCGTGTSPQTRSRSSLIWS